MKRRPASLPVPQLLIDEHPIKGAPAVSYTHLTLPTNREV